MDSGAEKPVEAVNVETTDGGAALVEPEATGAAAEVETAQEAVADNTVTVDDAEQSPDAGDPGMTADADNIAEPTPAEVPTQNEDPTTVVLEDTVPVEVDNTVTTEKLQVAADPAIVPQQYQVQEQPTIIPQSGIINIPDPNDEISKPPIMMQGEAIPFSENEDETGPYYQGDPNLEVEEHPLIPESELPQYRSVRLNKKDDGFSDSEDDDEGEGTDHIKQIDPEQAARNLAALEAALADTDDEGEGGSGGNNKMNQQHLDEDDDYAKDIFNEATALRESDAVETENNNEIGGPDDHVVARQPTLTRAEVPNAPVTEFFDMSNNGNGNQNALPVTNVETIAPGGGEETVTLPPESGEEGEGGEGKTTTGGGAKAKAQGDVIQNGDDAEGEEDEELRQEMAHNEVHKSLLVGPVGPVQQQNLSPEQNRNPLEQTTTSNNPLDTTMMKAMSEVKKDDPLLLPAVQQQNQNQNQNIINLNQQGPGLPSVVEQSTDGNYSSMITQPSMAPVAPTPMSTMNNQQHTQLTVTSDVESPQKLHEALLNQTGYQLPQGPPPPSPPGPVPYYDNTMREAHARALEIHIATNRNLDSVHAPYRSHMDQYFSGEVSGYGDITYTNKGYSPNIKGGSTSGPGGQNLNDLNFNYNQQQISLLQQASTIQPSESIETSDLPLPTLESLLQDWSYLPDHAPKPAYKHKVTKPTIHLDGVKKLTKSGKLPIINSSNILVNLVQDMSKPIESYELITDGLSEKEHEMRRKMIREKEWRARQLGPAGKIAFGNDMVPDVSQDTVTGNSPMLKSIDETNNQGPGSDENNLQLALTNSNGPPGVPNAANTSANYHLVDFSLQLNNIQKMYTYTSAYEKDMLYWEQKISEYRARKKEEKKRKQAEEEENENNDGGGAGSGTRGNNKKGFNANAKKLGTVGKKRKDIDDAKKYKPFQGPDFGKFCNTSNKKSDGPGDKNINDDSDDDEYTFNIDALANSADEDFKDIDLDTDAIPSAYDTDGGGNTTDAQSGPESINGKDNSKNKSKNLKKKALIRRKRKFLRGPIRHTYFRPIPPAGLEKKNLDNSYTNISEDYTEEWHRMKAKVRLRLREDYITEEWHRMKAKVFQEKPNSFESDSLMTVALWKLQKYPEQRAYLMGLSDALTAITKGRVRIFSDIGHIDSAIKQRPCGDALERLAQAILVLQRQYLRGYCTKGSSSNDNTEPGQKKSTTTSNSRPNQAGDYQFSIKAHAKRLFTQAIGPGYKRNKVKFSKYKFGPKAWGGPGIVRGGKFKSNDQQPGAEDDVQQQTVGGMSSGDNMNDLLSINKDILEDASLSPAAKKTLERAMFEVDDEDGGKQVSKATRKGVTGPPGSDPNSKQYDEQFQNKFQQIGSQAHHQSSHTRAASNVVTVSLHGNNPLFHRDNMQGSKHQQLSPIDHHHHGPGHHGTHHGHHHGHHANGSKQMHNGNATTSSKIMATYGVGDHHGHGHGHHPGVTSAKKRRKMAAEALWGFGEQEVQVTVTPAMLRSKKKDAQVQLSYLSDEEVETLRACHNTLIRKQHPSTLTKLIKVGNIGSQHGHHHGPHNHVILGDQLRTVKDLMIAISPHHHGSHSNMGHKKAAQSRGKRGDKDSNEHAGGGHHESSHKQSSHSKSRAGGGHGTSSKSMPASHGGISNFDRFFGEKMSHHGHGGVGDQMTMSMACDELSGGQNVSVGGRDHNRESSNVRTGSKDQSGTTGVTAGTSGTTSGPHATHKRPMSNHRSHGQQAGGHQTFTAQGQPIVPEGESRNLAKSVKHQQFQEHRHVHLSKNKDNIFGMSPQDRKAKAEEIFSKGTQVRTKNMVELENYDPQLIYFSMWIHAKFGSPQKALRVLDENGNSCLSWSECEMNVLKRNMYPDFPKDKINLRQVFDLLDTEKAGMLYNKNMMPLATIKELLTVIEHEITSGILEKQVQDTVSSNVLGLSSRVKKARTEIQFDNAMSNLGDIEEIKRQKMVDEQKKQQMLAAMNEDEGGKKSSALDRIGGKQKVNTMGTIEDLARSQPVVRNIRGQKEM